MSLKQPASPRWLLKGPSSVAIRRVAAAPNGKVALSIVGPSMKGSRGAASLGERA
jgi:hypothetical protein